MIQPLTELTEGQVLVYGGDRVSVVRRSPCRRPSRRAIDS